MLKKPFLPTDTSGLDWYNHMGALILSRAYEIIEEAARLKTKGAMLVLFAICQALNIAARAIKMAVPPLPVPPLIPSDAELKATISAWASEFRKGGDQCQPK